MNDEIDTAADLEALFIVCLGMISVLIEAGRDIAAGNSTRFQKMADCENAFGMVMATKILPISKRKGWKVLQQMAEKALEGE